MAWLAIALGAAIICEQPGSSLLGRHPRFQQLCSVHKAIMQIMFFSHAFNCPAHHLLDPSLPKFHQPCATPQIFKTWFWMGHWSHPTPKRTLLWGNTRAIAYFWRGRMTKKQRKTLKKKNKVAGFSPVKQYRDGKGRRRFHGTSALTQTQNLGSMIQIADESGSTMFNMFNICIHCI